MAQQMPLQHKSLFHTMSQAEFEHAVQALDADIPQLDDDQIIVRFAQIGAMIQDGHSGVSLLEIHGDKTHIPVRFEQYADGVYVRAAAPEYAEAVGGRVVQVGSRPWQEAMERIDSVVPHDPGNDGEQRAWAAPIYLNYPLVLHGLGLSASDQSADFVIEKNGQRRTFPMRPASAVGEWYLYSMPPDWVDARPKSVPAPLWIERADQPYWFTELPKHRAVYFQFNGVINGEGETLSDFATRLGAAIGQHDVDRLIIDLRHNPGGNNTPLRPLLVALIGSKLNKRGGIYTLIAPTTFSAAQNFVNRLENYTETIFVGEPTGNNVNLYGDAKVIDVPHSHLGVAVSYLWWQDKDPRDSRTATFPEIAASATFQDYVAGRDPALDLALTTPTPPTLEESLEAGLKGGPASVLDRYSSYGRDPAHKYVTDTEQRVNRLGYILLAEKRMADAITIFAANVRTHPQSSNAYDSLGEAYADAGDKQHALENYRRSVELNPGNTGGKEMIERLSKGTQ